jgi:hypothetical protein
MKRVMVYHHGVKIKTFNDSEKAYKYFISEKNNYE